MVKKSVVRQFVALLLVEVLVAQPIQPLRHPLFNVAEAEPASSGALLPATPPEAVTDAPQSNAFTAAADASALDVFVGFADSSSASANFPTPWQGSPNVVYLGGGTPVDAGAIRLDNTSGLPIAIDSVSVDLQRANAQFSLWQNFTIPARGSAVLTQTLMPKIGGGLIPAAELLMVGYGARQHVRKNALQHLHQEITITRRQGSFTLEESLTELVKRN